MIAMAWGRRVFSLARCRIGDWLRYSACGAGRSPGQALQKVFKMAHSSGLKLIYHSVKTPVSQRYAMNSTRGGAGIKYRAGDRTNPAAGGLLGWWRNVYRLFGKRHDIPPIGVRSTAVHAIVVLVSDFWVFIFSTINNNPAIFFQRYRKVIDERL